MHKKHKIKLTTSSYVFSKVSELRKEVIMIYSFSKEFPASTIFTLQREIMKHFSHVGDGMPPHKLIFATISIKHTLFS